MHVRPGRPGGRGNQPHGIGIPYAAFAGATFQHGPPSVFSRAQMQAVTRRGASSGPFVDLHQCRNPRPIFNPFFICIAGRPARRGDRVQPVFAKVIAPLLDALPDAILLVDEGGRIMFANLAVRDLLGYEPSALVGQQVGTLVPGHSRALHERLMAAFWQEPRRRAMTARPFLHALSSAGEEVAVTISLAPISISGTRCCVAALRDASAMQARITGTSGGLQQ